MYSIFNSVSNLNSYLIHVSFSVSPNSIGGGTIFKGGGQIFGGRRACATQGVVWGGMCPPAEVGAFLKIWAQMKRFGALFFIMLNIKQHVYWGVFLLYNRMVKKVEEPCLPVWKVEGPLDPLAPRFRRLCQTVSTSSSARPQPKSKAIGKTKPKLVL